ncbi:MAG: hypothetical protein RJA97_233 [Bacteroidota bacterium]|jgi:hypothetical protein
MKKYFFLTLAILSFGAAAQDGTVEKPKADKAKVEATTSEDSTSAPGLLIGVGLLPSHQLRRDGFTSTPIRIQAMGTRLYKNFGLFAAVEFASADAPFADNSSDPNDPSTWANSYFRHMLGLQYSFGKFGAYAGMDMFSKNGFFRSVGQGGTIGSGRKTIGATYNAYKGLTVSLDFSAYAGPAIGINYLVPLNGLK